MTGENIGPQEKRQVSWGRGAFLQNEAARFVEQFWCDFYCRF